MIRRMLLALVALAIPAALVSGQAMAQMAKGDPVRLPFAYVFSGTAQDFGDRVWNEAVVPFVAELNEKKGGIKGRPLEFYKVDVRFPETAPWITDFRRLASDPKIPIIFPIGPSKSHLAIIDLTEEYKVPTYTGSLAKWPKPSFGNWTFRYGPQVATSMPPILEKAKAVFGTKKVALAYTQDDEFNVNNANELRKMLPRHGITIVEEQTYKGDDTNMAAQVAKIRAANVDAVVLTSQPWTAGVFTFQLRERGVDVPILSDPGILGVDYWRLSKGKGENAYAYSIFNPHDKRPIVQDFIQLWRKTVSKPEDFPDYFVVQYYDMLIALAHVLNTSDDLSRDAIRRSFLAVKDFETISGEITWSEPGDVVRSKPVMITWKDGVMVPWE